MLRIYNQSAVLEVKRVGGRTNGERLPVRLNRDMLLEVARLHKAAGYPNLEVNLPPDQSEEEFLQNYTQVGFTPVEAAGGVVTNPSGHWLLIYRREKWDLPKGKLDPGETPPQAALREVQEETGLTRLELGLELPRTYHIYPEKSFWMLKTTYWYWMRSPETPALTPQLEEGITQAEWTPVDRATLESLDTHASMRELMLQAWGQRHASQQ